MRTATKLLVALALLSCCGCSMISIGYNHADWYLNHKINDYTSFDAQQKERIRREVELYMQWHRTHALPEYTAFLQNLYGLIQPENQVKAENVSCIRNELKDLYRLTVNPAIPPTAQILSTLDHPQIEELRKTLTEQNQQMIEESLSGSMQKNLDKRAESIVDFAESLVGDLSDEQTKAITTTSLRMPFASRDYLQHRASNQTRLLAMLNSHYTGTVVSEFLYSWINTPEATRTPQQQSIMLSYESAIDELVVQIYGMLTERQKHHLRDKILSYIHEFQHLNPEMKPERKVSAC